MKALFFVSVFTTVLCAVLVVVNAITHQYVMLIASAVGVLAAVMCVVSVKVLKNSTIASLIPSVFCGCSFHFWYPSDFAIL